MRAARPTRSTRWFGTTVNWSASDSPPATALIESCRRRVETLRTTSVRVACQCAPCQSPKPSVAGCAATSPTADAPSRNVPAPTAVAGARPRLRVADEQAVERRPVERGPHLREQRGAAGDRRRGPARAVDRAVERRAVGGRARLGRRERDARRGDVRLDAAVEREPERREARDLAARGVRVDVLGADRDADVEPGAPGGEQLDRRRRRHDDDRARSRPRRRAATPAGARRRRGRPRQRRRARPRARLPADRRRPRRRPPGPRRC